MTKWNFRLTPPSGQRDMLMQVPSRQVTTERGSLTASHFPGVSMYNFECETK